MSQRKNDRHPTRPKITRERRRLKGFKHQLDLGKISLYDVRNWYRAWRENMLKECQCVRTIRNMDALFRELFGIDPMSNSVKLHIPTFTRSRMTASRSR